MKRIHPSHFCGLSQRRLLMPLLALALGGAPICATAMSDGSYRIDGTVINSGAGTMSAGGVVLVGSLGEAIVGTASSGNQQLAAGFLAKVMANAVTTPPPITGSDGQQATLGAGKWNIDSAATAGFIPTSGHVKSPPNLPVGYSFPYGLLDLTLTGAAAGGPATVTITFPAPLPTNTVWWKYGPTVGNPVAHWYPFPAVIVGNTVTLILTDDADGDDAYTTPGTITDPGGPGVALAPGAPTGVAGVPTLSQWGLVLLSVLLVGVAWRRKVSGASA